jgi:hypothetical protein
MQKHLQRKSSQKKISEQEEKKKKQKSIIQTRNLILHTISFDLSKHESAGDHIPVLI